jgi:FkbM family methyltransferase
MLLVEKMRRWVHGRVFLFEVARRIGLSGSLVYIFTANRNKQSQEKVYQLKSRDAKWPLLCRPGTSDRAVFSQIFIEGQYGDLPRRGDEKLILDCGANVGYASALFLSRYPEAHVIAIEPEPENYQILVRNMKPYGERVTTIQAAVWPRVARLGIASGTRGWDAHVEETTDLDAQAVRAIDMPSLLALMPGYRVDILKVDIEGAEEVLFAEETERWIDYIDVCAAELHGGKCEKAFHRVYSQEFFETYSRGELTVAVRRRQING